jgi:nicotinamide-nucleotide amidase
VIVELINTGTELMLGAVLNSHQQWLCRQLADLGYLVSRQVAIADDSREISQALRESLSRADLVVTTGGLGPTSDDLTRDCAAQLLGRKLRENPEALAGIQAFFKLRNRPMPERTRVEALVPEGALVLPNRQGTAPGLALEINPNPFRQGTGSSWLILLPGPGRELRPMFADSVVPLLQRSLPQPEDFVCLTLRSTGLGESVVQEKIEESLRTLTADGLEVGYCARPGQVDVRVSAFGNQARQLVAKAEAIVRTRLGPEIFGIGDEELEDVVIRLMTEQKQTLAVAESCTGGCIAHRLTNVPGASAVLRAGLVTYSNEAKQQFLGVRAETLDRHGAVSEAVACEMAEGARRVNRTDYAIGVTGIAGPAGGAPDKPVGTVYIALAAPRRTTVQKMFNAWDRQTFKDVTSRQALNQLRFSLLQKPE